MNRWQLAAGTFKRSSHSEGRRACETGQYITNYDQRIVPRHLQKHAILWGTVGAIAVRSSMTLVVVWLLKIPGLLLVGGAMLIWIAYRLLLPENGEGEGDNVKAAVGF